MDELEVGRKYRVTLDVWGGLIQFDGVLTSEPDEGGNTRFAAIGEIEVVTGTDVEIREIQVTNE